jgi:thiamine biosynthesis lipoprotein
MRTIINWFCQGTLKLPHFKLAVFSLVGGLVVQASPSWVVREAFLMGTTLSASIASPSRESSLRALDSAFAAVRRVDDVLNDWRLDTDLARLNHAEPGTSFVADPRLGAFLDEILYWTRETGAAFDPGIGSLVQAWDLRGTGRIPEDSVLLQARLHSGLVHFFPDSTARQVRRPDQSSWIDAGGFGKGAALRAARDQLVRLGASGAILNFGGQVLVLGDTALVVEVAHPRHRFQPVAGFRLTNASASTTSQSERFVEVGGRRLGHVLDPRTGTPVPAWGSVTVVHPDPMIADILSTALFVMGPADGMRWLQGRSIAALFLVSKGDSVESRSTPALQSILTHSTVSRGK